MFCLDVVHHVQAVLRRSEEGAESLETGVTDGCEPPRACWGLNLGLLQEQQVLLIAESFLQPLLCYL